MNIIDLVFAVSVLAAIIWSLVGIPIGVYKIVKNKKSKYIALYFIGPALLPLLFFLYFIFNILSGPAQKSDGFVIPTLSVVK